MDINKELQIAVESNNAYEVILALKQGAVVTEELVKEALDHYLINILVNMCVFTDYVLDTVKKVCIEQNRLDYYYGIKEGMYHKMYSCSKEN